MTVQPANFTPIGNGEVTVELARDKINYRCLSDIKSVPIQWLWPGRIAKGKTTMIAGDPGLGKSQITISMAAIVTNGGVWPAERTQATQGNVIILSAEDDPADTIRPRLEASGANVSKIFTIDAVSEGDQERQFNLTKDLARLGEMLQQVGNVALVIIDPITAYLGGTDSHKNADIRGLMAPLGILASNHGVAIVCVSHLNKSGGSNALSRVTGSLAFVAAARAAYIVTKDPNDDSRRLFLPAKNNIGPDNSGLAYRIEPITTNGIETCRVMWDSELITMTADEAISQMPDEMRTARDDAKEWLYEYLRDGPKLAKDIYRDAGQCAFSKRTLDTAKSELKVITRKREFSNGAWVWELPDDSPTKIATPSDCNLATFDETSIKQNNLSTKDSEGCNLLETEEPCNLGNSPDNRMEPETSSTGGSGYAREECDDEVLI